MAGGVIPLGTTDFRGQHKPFYIRTPDMARHVYVCGASGSGKSTLLLSMMAAHARRGEGFGLIDPHGELADQVLDRIPAGRINHTIAFDPSDAWPVGLNILASGDPSQRDLLVSRVVSLFKTVWGESLIGPRSEDLLRNATHAVIGIRGATLLWLPKFLVDDEFRAAVVEQITDPVVKKFWTQEFAGYSRQFREEVIAPIQNKLRSFLTMACMRGVIAQAHRKVLMSEVMDRSQIIVANLAKGKIGEDNAALLASLLLEEFYLSALARGLNRPQFFLYVDECQNVKGAQGSVLDAILSEARKYLLSLVLSHQYLEQLPHQTQAAIFGNCATQIAFRVSGGDSEIFAQQFGGEPQATDYTHLANYTAYIRLSVNGETTYPFSMRTLPPPKAEGHRDTIRTVSRKRFGRPLDIIERSVAQQLNGPHGHSKRVP
jgi:hypothetical protein